MMNCGRILRTNSLCFLRCSTPLLRSAFSSSPFINTHPLLRRNEESSADSTENDSPKLFVVQPRLRPDSLLNSSLSEALNLANSLDEQRDGFFSTDFALKTFPPHVVVQNPLASSSKARAATYFGPGTIKNIRSHILATESEASSCILSFFLKMVCGRRNLQFCLFQFLIIDHLMVTVRAGCCLCKFAINRNSAEKSGGKAIISWDKPVLDRVALIIEIFHAHAYTKEAKLQAELAALMYKKSRLVRERGLDGRGTFGAKGDIGSEVVSARGRGSGGRGFISGAGETELELQRRRISERRIRLLAEIEEVRRTRSLQRASRKRRGGSGGQGLATIAVVGYTNAGKSTLVSTLSDSDLYSDDRLFATVDPRLRGMTLPSGRRVLLSDTVGFISDLPVQLIEAFHATLEEVAEADLLVHVLDSSAPNLEEHKSAVLQVLKQIGIADYKIQNMIEVWNKIDVQENLDPEEYQYDDKEVDTDNIEDEYRQESDDEVGKALLSDDEGKQCDDYSDGWSTSEEEQVKSSDQDGLPDDIDRFESETTPHVKTSALTGVGLQELLALVDEKLVAIEDEEKSNRIVGRGEFDRKWRPPSRVKEDDIAVEI
ncbi:LOW QUALITY PROTEIN: hypothetical protein V2J09_016395 [Rumex salicifolius]